MSEGNDVLKDAVTKSIKRIEAERAVPRLCASHGSIADGMHTLLLCKRSELERVIHLPGVVWGIIVGVAGVAGAAAAVVALCIGRS